MEVFLNIDGIGKAQYQINEYVSTTVSKKYSPIIRDFKEILNKVNVTAKDYNDIIDLLQRFANLAINGVVENVGGTPVKSYMSKEMVKFADLIVQSLRAAHITPSSSLLIPDSEKISRVKQWQNLKGFGVAEILDKAAKVDIDPHTLQSLIEIQYIREGNELIAKTLSELQKALSTTQGILDVMAIVQGISNQITVTNRGNFHMPPSVIGTIPIIFRISLAGASSLGSIVSDGKIPIKSAFREMLKQDALEAGAIIGTDAQKTILFPNASVAAAFLLKTHFASAILQFINNPVVPTGTDPANRFEKAYRALASAQFQQLFPVATPTSTASTELKAAKVSLLNQIAFLSTLGIKKDDVNTLANFLFKVALDISTYVKDGSKGTQFSWIQRWILDNQDKRAGSPDAQLAGSIQNNIVQSIKAAQSLNDSKKEDVRRYMLFFDQFYKSSSDVLQKCTQMIERMAQQISR